MRPVTRGRGAAAALALLAPVLLALALLALALLLGACVGPSQPFQPAAKGGNDLLWLPDSTGIAVSSILGDVPRPRPGDPTLAEAMVAALQKQNVPATVAEGGEMSRWLLGTARLSEAPDAAGRMRLELTWNLYEADGTPLGERRHHAQVRPERWRHGDPALLARLARTAAPRLAGLIQRPGPEEVRLGGYPAGTRVVVGQVAGAPGTGARALARAMARELRERRLPLADQAQAGDVVVEGRLRLGDPAGGVRPLEVVWIVRREGDSGRLGDLRQANSIPVARLAQGWNGLAALIARAAAPGVTQVLEAGAPDDA